MTARGLVWTLVAVAGVSLALPAPAPAQKARPVRIEFERGAVSTVVDGQLRGRQQMEYVVAARTKQTLALELASTPAGTVALRVRDPDGGEVPLEHPGSRRWTALLSRSGDHDVWVRRVSDRPGVSTYRLTVTIR